MNPFQPDAHKSFFGKNLIEWFVDGKKRGKHTRTWQYGKMKEKQIAKRRKRNKAARKTRRENRIRSQKK
jgi:hypothetical protein